MATSGFDSYYGDNPWSGIATNQRDWYVPDLLDVFRARSIYRQFVPMQVDLAAQRTKQMVFSLVYDLEPNTDTIGLRDLWLPASHTDSASLTINMEHHGDKVALHKYDELVTYWQRNGRKGLRPIVRDLIGLSMVDTLDILARNAFLSAPYAMYSGTATGFDDLGTSDLFDPDTVQDIWLGLSYREVPLANNPAGVDGTIFAITTPGVLYDVQTQGTDDWVNLLKYNDVGRALRYEVGMYKNARFLQTTRNTLWNCGAVSKQCTIISALNPGSGAAATVDTVYSVGQSGATNYIQLSAFSAGDFEVNDIVTIHTTRTSAFGVTDGVDYRSGMNTVRRIVSVDAANDRIAVDKPVMKDYSTDLGSTVYGYVTKGRHIHATVFVGGPNGVVAGVAQPPEFHTPAVVDDLEAMYRFSWDTYLKYQAFRPEVYEVVFSAGSVRLKGDVVNQ